MSDSKILINQIEEQIIQKIIDGEFEEGERLPNEFGLAEMFDVSRGTIREAVKVMVSKNILEIRRGKGTFVSSELGVQEDPLGLRFYPNKYQKARDLLQIRQIIEPEIAVLAVQQATDDDIAELKKLADEIEVLYSERNFKFVEKDKNFHTALANCTSNIIMPKLVPIIVSSIAVYNEFYLLRNDPKVKESISLHRVIISAIEERDEEKARKSMLEHLKINWENLEKAEEMGRDTIEKSEVVLQ